MRLTTFVAVVFILFVLGNAGSARQSPTAARRFEGVRWHSVRSIQFSPDRRAEALTLLYDKFMPILDNDETLRPRIYEFATGGSWDVMIVTPLPGGPGELEWEVRPIAATWLERLGARSDGEESAKKMFATYQAAILRSEFHLLREREGDDYSPAALSPVRVQR